MKLIYLTLFLVALNTVQGSWLSDIFTGLNEAVDDSDIKTKVKTTIENLGTKVKKIKEDVSKELKKEAPKHKKLNNDWVKITRDFLHEIKFADASDENMEVLVNKWNNVIQGLNRIDGNPMPVKQMKNLKKQIKKDLRDLLTQERYQQWEARVYDMKKKIKEVVKEKLESTDIDVLKKTVNAWMQPSFMENKENVEEEKQMVKDAVDAVNEKLKEQEADEKIVPLIKLSQSKTAQNAQEEMEEKVEKWLQKKFTKPHHKSGESKWQFLKKMGSLDELKKKMKNVPFKKIKKHFKKMAKMNKKLVVVNEPIKTAVKVITGEKIPLFLSQEDSKKMESLSPEEQEANKLAEAKWEAKVFKEIQKLTKKMHKKEMKKKKNRKTTPAPTPMITGNEDWVDEDMSVNEDEIIPFQNTRKQLKKKEFSDDLADVETEWFAMRKKLSAMLN